MLGVLLNSSSAPNGYFELHFRPDVRSVRLVRRFVADMYQRFLSDPEGTSRIALAAHELLENAARFSKDGEATLRIEVEMERRPRAVRIVLRNRAEPSNIAAIREIVERVAGAPSASTFYGELIEKRVRTRDRSGGFGLARICAEADMKLTSRVVDDDISVIEATTSVGGDVVRE
jgi:anti-sigma regulatory factor (Ser/Thr protein kinase)